MRLDRFITLNLVRPLRRASGALAPRHSSLVTHLPILMYHSISDGPEVNVAPYYRTCTTPNVFAQHMALLKSEGYRGVDLSTGLAYLKSSVCGPPASDPRTPVAFSPLSAFEGEGQGEVASFRPPTSGFRPPRSRPGTLPLHHSSFILHPSPVVLTFDDGFRDFYTTAFPILKEHGFTATMFLATAYIQDRRRSFKGKECMTWSEVKELHEAGIEFGSHTVTHPKLVELDWALVESEISDSKSEIGHRLGVPVTTFAYPYAFPQVNKKFCDRLRKRLVAAGYQSCLTTIVGRGAKGNDPYTLRRLPVNDEDDRALLLAKMTGDYDWVGRAQLASKRLKVMFTNGSRNVVLDRPSSRGARTSGLKNRLRPRGQYVLVTPTKNEEASIGVTIESVVNQTIRPTQWVVVSDGSTDRTDEIVRAAVAAHPWIRLLSLPPSAERNFAAVVHATEAGARVLTVEGYEYIGLLDSDVRFQPDYFERVIEQFESCPRLGLAGGLVIDLGLSTDRLPRNRDDVPGAAQFFRRKCFEELGGLVAIPEGGWDALTCARARMLGYETRLLTNLVVDHLKPRNIYEGGLLRRTWQLGVRDYVLGYHPLFEVFKCLGRLFESPLLVGGIAWWVGYCCAAIQRRERLIPGDLLEFLRDEQKRRLKGLLPSFRP